MKKILTIALASLGLMVSGIALAEEGGATTQTFREQRAELREQRRTALMNWEGEKEQWKARREEVLANLKQQKEAFKALKEKFTDEKCARIGERLQNREANFEDVKEKHLSVYANLVERINKFIARFKENNLNTAILEGHLAELEKKIELFKDDYAAYAAKLQSLKDLTCGHAEGEFRSGLLESKTLLKTVHADAADIRTYMRETILADIKNLKAQMPKAEEDEDRDEAEEAETENKQ